ncbi:MAG: LytR C-terminal domain-containing protein [Frankiaceae bacterium]|nr:LytR C-terminal domain-containing protein [Frankiaceae bacterium]
MTIPSGDLVPMRKHRRYGHRRSRWPVVLTVLVVIAVAAGAYALQQRTDDDGGTAVTPGRCASPSASVPAAPRAPVAAPAVRLPAPAAVRLRLLNGTPRDGLARVVANELVRRGFTVTATGNAPRSLVGPSRVYYGPGGRPAALLASAHVLGASVVPVPKAARGALDVVLGSTFVRLRTPAETSAFARELAAGSPLAVPPASTPAPSPTCR